MATKQEIEARLKRAEETQEHLVAGLKNEVAEAERKLELKDLALTEAQDEIDRLKADLAKANEHPFLKALNEFVEERVRALRIEIGTAAGARAQALDVTLTEPQGTLKIEPEAPVPYTYSESGTTGRILAVMVAGKSKRKWLPTEITDGIVERWGVGDEGRPAIAKDVGRRLPELIKEKILLRDDDGHAHYSYWIAENIKLEGQ